MSLPVMEEQMKQRMGVDAGTASGVRQGRASGDNPRLTDRVSYVDRQTSPSLTSSACHSPVPHPPLERWSCRTRRLPSDSSASHSLQPQRRSWALDARRRAAVGPAAPSPASVPQSWLRSLKGCTKSFTAVRPVSRRERRSVTTSVRTRIRKTCGS